MKKNKFIKQMICIILTIVSVALSFTICEPIVFTKMEFLQKIHNKLYFLTVIAFIIFVYFIWHTIINLIIRLKNKDKITIQFLKHFVIYLGMMTFFLIILWPGHWVWDEVNIINNLQEYRIDMWQSVITQIYYAMALLIFPYPVSIVIMQIIFISLIVAYIQLKLEKIYKNKWCNFFFYIAFLVPSIILNNLYVLRTTMHAYLVLLFFAILIFDYKEQNVLTIPKEILLYVLSSFIILWRSEGIIFLVLIPVLISLVYKEMRNIINIILIVIILIGTYLGYNKIFEKQNELNKEYSMLIYVNPLSIMFQEDLNINQTEIDKINAVMNIDALKKYPSYTDVPSYWTTDLLRVDYQKHLNEFIINYAKIIIKNPISFLKARTHTLLAASGMDVKVIPQVGNRYLNRYIGRGDDLNKIVDSFCRTHKYMNPIFKDLKINVESLLSGEAIWASEQVQIIKIVFWNFIPILIALFVIGIINLVKKEWLMLALCISLLAKSAIVFLTAPSSFFMYYYPEYITGILIIFITIYDYFIEKNGGKKKHDRIIKTK